MPSLSEATQDIVGTIRGIVGLSRAGRIREQIDHTLTLYERVDKVQGLEAVRDDLAAVMGHQSSELRRLADPDTKVSRDWFGFIVIAIVIDGPIFALTYWGWTFARDDAEWWSVVWVVLGCVLSLLFAAGTVGMLFSQDKSSSQRN